jgi:RNA polymerase sigma-70 factor (ECF subfamily)
MPFKNLSDKDLMLHVASGNERAFEQLYHRYSTKMLSYVYGKVHNKAVAEEIVHDAFLKLWNGRETLAITDNWSGYFFIMVRNQALQYLRSIDDIDRFVDEIYAAGIPDTSAATSFKDYQSLEQALENKVQGLPEKMRIVYQLSRDHALSTREIAGRLDISPQTVKNQVSKALRLLKTHLREVQSFFF